MSESTLIKLISDATGLMMIIQRFIPLTEYYCPKMRSGSMFELEIDFPMAFLRMSVMHVDFYV